MLLLTSGLTSGAQWGPAGSHACGGWEVNDAPLESKWPSVSFPRLEEKDDFLLGVNGIGFCPSGGNWAKNIFSCLIGCLFFDLTLLFVLVILPYN